MLNDVNSKDFKKVFEEDLKKLKEEREVLLEAMKDMYPHTDDLQNLALTIASYNATIKELEGIIHKAKMLAGK